MADNRLAARIDAFVKRLQKEDVNMHGFILSVNGQEKAKAYYAPFQEGIPHRMYSVSKTMTGIAVGMLIGLFSGLAARKPGRKAAAPDHPGYAAHVYLLPLDYLSGGH